jgi:hypothetical protein
LLYGPRKVRKAIKERRKAREIAKKQNTQNSSSSSDLAIGPPSKIPTGVAGRQWGTGRVQQLRRIAATAAQDTEAHAGPLSSRRRPGPR